MFDGDNGTAYNGTTTARTAQIVISLGSKQEVIGIVMPDPNDPVVSCISGILTSNDKGTCRNHAACFGIQYIILVQKELYRVDNALTLAGERLVSDSFVVEVPAKENLPRITCFRSFSRAFCPLFCINRSWCYAR